MSKKEEPLELILSDDEVVVLHLSKYRRRHFIRICGCCTALFLILAVVMIILAFTVFTVQDPVIKLNGLQVTQIKFMDDGEIPDPTVNITIMVDISVKNPNLESFKYSNTTTKFFYRNNMVSGTTSPSGVAKARRTNRRNVTLEIDTARLLADPGVGLRNDWNSGILNMTSYTEMHGKVKLMKMVNKKFEMKMSCEVSVNLTSKVIQEQKCERVFPS